MGVEVEVLVQGSGFPHLRSSVVLARTRSRVWLIDCGAPEDRDHLVTSLRCRGLAPTDIDGVLLTHLHGDHFANIDLFSSATVYVHDRELESLDRLVGLKREEDLEHELDSQYEVLHPVYRRLFGRWLCAGSCHLPVPRGQIRSPCGNVEIDDGVTMVESPGHSIGHMSVKLVTDHGNTWVIGDLVGSADELRAATETKPTICWNLAERARSLSALADTTGLIMPAHGLPFRLEPLPRAARVP